MYWGWQLHRFLVCYAWGGNFIDSWYAMRGVATSSILGMLCVGWQLHRYGLFMIVGQINVCFW
jgi:hypothetical protein